MESVTNFLCEIIVEVFAQYLPEPEPHLESSNWLGLDGTFTNDFFLNYHSKTWYKVLRAWRIPDVLHAIRFM